MTTAAVEIGDEGLALRVEEALAAATSGDLEPFGRLLDVLSDPYSERHGLEDYAVAPAPGARPYQTFCGT